MSTLEVENLRKQTSIICNTNVKYRDRITIYDTDNFIYDTTIMSFYKSIKSDIENGYVGLYINNEKIYFNTAQQIDDTLMPYFNMARNRYDQRKDELMKNKEASIRDDGAMVVAPTYGEVDRLPMWNGYKLEFPFNDTWFYDIKLDKDCKLLEAKYRILDNGYISDNDYVEISIIDKDNVLGLFDNYGLVPGADIIEVRKIVRGEFIKGNFGQIERGISAMPLKGGLYIRVAYNSFKKPVTKKIPYIDPIIAYVRIYMYI